jgi:hypothetical protein
VRITQDPFRRGAALLIVLATLVITITAVTIMMKATASIQAARKIDQCKCIADDLLGAADAPIHHWLRKQSASVALPPDAPSPYVEILHDAWRLDGTDTELQITAFDQCGMVPLEAARGGLPLRLVLSPDVLRLIDRNQVPASNNATALAGLDWFASTDADHKGIGVFPLPEASVVMRFGGVLGAAQESSSQSSPRSMDPSPMALGEMIATHNAKPGRININTAPKPLLEAAMRLAGRGGVDEILASRKAGKAATMGAQATPVANSGDANFIPQIVATSTCWSFRIDIHAGPLWRSWWAVYQPGQTSLSDGGWECTQRLAITE